MGENLDIRKLISLIIILAFLSNTLGLTPMARAQSASRTGLTTGGAGGDFRLPAPGVMVHLSPEFNPPILKGIKVHPDNPFRFDFILDQGDSLPLVGRAREGDLKQEATKLIKYFLASLTIPEKDLWVNLSPYEKNRIIPQSFGLTEMGRDLLAEDYMLKQITASLIYPEDEVGKKFWKRIYEEAAKKFGTTNIPVNTFNKVWIVPEKAVVYENAQAGTAYVVESKLKVMLEEDYLALSKNTLSQPGDMFNKEQQNVSPSTLPSELGLHTKATQGNHITPNKDVNALGSQIVREIVIPELTKEVNEDKNFGKLRQVYNSLILATWYKKKIKDSILSQVYADKNKTAGVNIDDPQEKQKIYERYLQAFKKGVYNYIKEEQDPLTQQIIPRKYFSGGLDMALTVSNYGMTAAFQTTHDSAEINFDEMDRAVIVSAHVDRAGDRGMGIPDIEHQEGTYLFLHFSDEQTREVASKPEYHDFFDLFDLMGRVNYAKFYAPRIHFRALGQDSPKVVIDEKFKSVVVNTDLFQGSVEDHDLIVMAFIQTDSMRGTGYYKEYEGPLSTKYQIVAQKQRSVLGTHALVGSSITPYQEIPTVRVKDLGEIEESREDKINAFKSFTQGKWDNLGLISYESTTETAFNSFESDIITKLEELKRQYAPDAQGSVWEMLSSGSQGGSPFLIAAEDSVFNDILKYEYSRLFRYNDFYKWVNEKFLRSEIAKVLDHWKPGDVPHPLNIAVVGASYGQEPMVMAIMADRVLQEALGQRPQIPKNAIILKVHVLNPKNKVYDALKENKIIYPLKDIEQYVKEGPELKQAQYQQEGYLTRDEFNRFFVPPPSGGQVRVRSSTLNNLFIFHDVKLGDVSTYPQNIQDCDILTLHNVLQYVKPENSQRSEEDFPEAMAKTYEWLVSIVKPGGVISLTNNKGDRLNEEVLKLVDRISNLHGDNFEQPFSVQKTIVVQKPLSATDQAMTGAYTQGTVQGLNRAMTSNPQEILARLGEVGQCFLPYVKAGFNNDQLAAMVEKAMAPKHLNDNYFPLSSDQETLIQDGVAQVVAAHEHNLTITTFGIGRKEEALEALDVLKVVLTKLDGMQHQVDTITLRLYDNNIGILKNTLDTIPLDIDQMPTGKIKVNVQVLYGDVTEMAEQGVTSPEIIMPSNITLLRHTWVLIGDLEKQKLESFLNVLTQAIKVGGLIVDEPGAMDRTTLQSIEGIVRNTVIPFSENMNQAMTSAELASAKSAFEEARETINHQERVRPFVFYHARIALDDYYGGPAMFESLIKLLQNDAIRNHYGIELPHQEGNAPFTVMVPQLIPILVEKGFITAPEGQGLLNRWETLSEMYLILQKIPLYLLERDSSGIPFFNLKSYSMHKYIPQKDAGKFVGDYYELTNAIYPILSKVFFAIAAELEKPRWEETSVQVDELGIGWEVGALQRGYYRDWDNVWQFKSDEGVRPVKFLVFKGTARDLKDIFEKTPEKMVDVFTEAVQRGLLIDDGVLEMMRSVKIARLTRDLDPVGRSFTRLMRLKENVAPLLVRMHEIGLFDQLFPELAQQKGFFPGSVHYFSVTYHTLYLLYYFENGMEAYLKEQGRDDVYQRVRNDENLRSILRFSILFHDAQKDPEYQHLGRPHPVEGANSLTSNGMSRFPGMDTAWIPWLVWHHQDLNARGRYSPVMKFCHRDLLDIISYKDLYTANSHLMDIWYLLTVADAFSVEPTSAAGTDPLKPQVHELYANLHRYYEADRETRERMETEWQQMADQEDEKIKGDYKKTIKDRDIQEAFNYFRAFVDDEEISREQRLYDSNKEEYIRNLYDEYARVIPMYYLRRIFVNNYPTDMAHEMIMFALVRGSKNSNLVVSRPSAIPTELGTFFNLTVNINRDSEGLLYKIMGLMATLGLDVVNAQVRTLPKANPEQKFIVDQLEGYFLPGTDFEKIWPGLEEMLRRKGIAVERQNVLDAQGKIDMNLVIPILLKALLTEQENQKITVDDIFRVNGIVKEFKIQQRNLATRTRVAFQSQAEGLPVSICSLDTADRIGLLYAASRIAGEGFGYNIAATPIFTSSAGASDKFSLFKVDAGHPHGRALNQEEQEALIKWYEYFFDLPSFTNDDLQKAVMAIKTAISEGRAVRDINPPPKKEPYRSSTKVYFGSLFSSVVSQLAAENRINDRGARLKNSVTRGIVVYTREKPSSQTSQKVENDFRRMLHELILNAYDASNDYVEHNGPEGAITTSLSKLEGSDEYELKIRNAGEISESTYTDLKDKLIQFGKMGRLWRNIRTGELIVSHRGLTLEYMTQRSEEYQNVPSDQILKEINEYIEEHTIESILFIPGLSTKNKELEDYDKDVQFQKSGSGMGLWTVQRILAKTFDGQIRIDDSERGYTSVIITFHGSDRAMGVDSAQLVQPQFNETELKTMLEGVAGHLKSQLKEMGYGDFEIDEHIDTDTANLPYADGVNVGSFMSAVDGIDVVTYWVYKKAQQQGNPRVNFLLLQPFQTLGFGRDNSKILYTTSAVYINKAGKIAMAIFDKPVRVDAFVHESYRVTRGLQQLEAHEIPVLNTSAIIEIAKHKEMVNQILSSYGMDVPAELVITPNEIDPTKILIDVSKFIDSHAPAEIVVKPASGAQGDGVRIFTQAQKQEIIDYVRELSRTDRVLVQNRIESEKWEGPQDHQLLDWNLRVLTTKDKEGRVYTNPDMIEVRFQPRDRNPVNKSKGAGVVTLREFFKVRGWGLKEQSKFLDGIQSVVSRATGILENQVARQQGHNGGTGLLGWDLIRGQDEKFYILEANAGPGGIGTIEKRLAPASKGKAILPIMEYLANVATIHFRDNQNVSMNDQIGENLGAPYGSQVSRAATLAFKPDIAEKILRFEIAQGEDLFFNLAVVLMRDGKYAEAEEVLKDARDKKFFSNSNYWGLAYVLIALKKYAEAEKILKEAISHDFISPGIYALFLWALIGPEGNDKESGFQVLREEIKKHDISPEEIEKQLKPYLPYLPSLEPWLERLKNADFAMMRKDKNTGGIDLTPAKMNLQTQNSGGGIKFHLDPAMLDQLRNAPGFVPVIINIQPMTDLRQFLGIASLHSQ